LKTLIQCDFDATLTTGEVSHTLLEHFARGDWKSIQKRYYESEITVEECNTRQFAMVKATPDELRAFLRTPGNVVMREGVKEFFDYCQQRGWHCIIISNGLKFYIEVVLDMLGITGVQVTAAECKFHPEGLRISYKGPDGHALMKGFKAARAEQQRQGYDRVYYLGDGMADLPPARCANHVFATGVLLNKCQEEGLPHTEFIDLYDVIKYFEAVDGKERV